MANDVDTHGLAIDFANRLCKCSKRNVLKRAALPKSRRGFSDAEDEQEALIAMFNTAAECAYVEANDILEEELAAEGKAARKIDEGPGIIEGVKERLLGMFNLMRKPRELTEEEVDRRAARERVYGKTMDEVRAAEAELRLARARAKEQQEQARSEIIEELLVRMAAGEEIDKESLKGEELRIYRELTGEKKPLYDILSDSGRGRPFGESSDEEGEATTAEEAARERGATGVPAAREAAPALLETVDRAALIAEIDKALSSMVSGETPPFASEADVAEAVADDSRPVMDVETLSDVGYGGLAVEQEIKKTVNTSRGVSTQIRMLQRLLAGIRRSVGTETLADRQLLHRLTRDIDILPFGPADLIESGEDTERGGLIDDFANLVIPMPKEEGEGS